MLHPHDTLIRFASACLQAGGLAEDRALVVAELLVEADMMGHDTHGLALLPAYVGELQSGGMKSKGEPEIVTDGGAIAVWDGHYLPGIWLTTRALEEASRRAKELGSGIISIRRSHHIACLQAYLPAITGRGQMAIISCSDPRMATVAPFGGVDPVFTPNPLACGIPTDGDPILIDISASITTNGMTNRLAAAGEHFPGIWALDHLGRPTDDPNAVTGEKPGALLPVGGLDHGHKGFALGIIVEAMTQGLAGHGRADPPEQWGGSVFIQVLDPDRFAGREAFERQTAHLVAACKASRPIEESRPVRLPGQSALVKRRQAQSDGVSLLPGIEEQLKSLGELVDVPWQGQ